MAAMLEENTLQIYNIKKLSLVGMQLPEKYKEFSLY
jgi:hypothetical protein